MKISKVFALSLAILSAATVMRGSVPIIVATPGRMRAAMNLVTVAGSRLSTADGADTLALPDRRHPYALDARTALPGRSGLFHGAFMASAL